MNKPAAVPGTKDIVEIQTEYPVNPADMAAFPPPTLAATASSLVTLLRSRNETISVAETAAGGLISAALLAQPGASRIFKGGATLVGLLGLEACSPKTTPWNNMKCRIITTKDS